MPNPLVSIVIPCYNAAPWIGAAIESCLQQTYSPLEVIVVDDGSTDQSLDVIRFFNSRIRWVSGPNRGGCHARNRGLKLSGGQYVMFLDADDFIAPNTIAVLVNALSERPAGIATCRWWYISQKGGKWKTYRPTRLPRDLDDIELELSGYYAVPGSMLFTRDRLYSVGGWDETLTAYQDMDLKLRCLLDGAFFIRVNAGGFYYRLHEGPSVSKDKSRAACHSQLRVLNKVEALMREREVLPQYRLVLAHTYRRLGENASQHAEIEAEFLHHASKLAGDERLEDDGTWLHNIVSSLIGENRKEWLARTLARYGIGRSVRRAYQDKKGRSHIN